MFGMNMAPETDVDVQAKQAQDSKTVTTDNENTSNMEWNIQFHHTILNLFLIHLLIFLTHLLD